MRNKYGWSDGYSPEIQVRAATIPSQVPATSFEINGETKVRVGWTEPYNGGSPITSFSVLFLESDGLTFSEIFTYCNGSLASIVTNKYCDVPFTELRTAPHSLTYSSLVVVKVSALNKIGQGGYSEQNTAGITV